MSVRCKFRLSEIHNVSWGPGTGSQKFVFTAVYDDGIPENQRFAKATPNGRFEVQIDNPEAQKRFELGKCYYFDTTPCE